MRKLLVLACAVAALAGCMSNPFFSTSYGEAHPNHVFENGDGSTIFEFRFILDPFDARKAMQRIDEYLASYASQKGFTGYDVENVDGRPIATGGGPASWVAPASASFVMDQTDKTTSAGGKDQYGRIRVQVRFKTEKFTSKD